MPPEKTEATSPTSTSNGGVEVITIPASFAEFALAIGLSHDASKGDVLAAMAQGKAEQKKLLDVVGAQSVDEAIGKVTAERATHGEIVSAIVGDGVKNPTSQDAIAKLQADRKTAERKQAEQMISEARSQGKTVGEKALGIFDAHGMGAFTAHLDALAAHGPLTNPVPAQKASSVTPALPGASAGGTATPFVLSADDEKAIKSYGLDREKFIARRQAEAADLAEATAGLL